MIKPEYKQEYYQALVDKKSEYEGLFYVGVKTTGVFCRPTCPARKPKFENCEFFETAQQALLASFRPCKRCRPLSHPNHVSEIVRTLVEAVEANPEKRWKDSDFQELSIDASTARRQFKKRFGMTFVEYARARRMGIAMKEIRTGKNVIDAQLSTGYESSSGFRDAFSRIMGAAPTLLGDTRILKAAWIDTRLGPMIAIADDELLYLLEFVDRRGLEREVERLRARMKAAVIPGTTPPIQSIERELNLYFEAELTHFETPIAYLGSPFQQMVWDELRKIPAGETRSYSQLATLIGKPSACRAVAQANGANQIAIVVPCHRIINTNGELGGYGGGLTRKAWLIHHEQQKK
ncbi:bifunctional transcriptional activator/DNA repair enzyme AdaA [Brevibacillus dissolubilis]|uniref:bifunctional transcriptional activator/DNA repair enzyme AdaA n=1 Tax=Brevibacillus dissolubilis TaxID=1844116 RepID=UPI001116E086|nr:trifunctional transcriptional activator/DNA repair protein Ada/methylated-DNA--[protein]-cysteine S-methyltransferase [Brevibacillus dissolubilis]